MAGTDRTGTTSHSPAGTPRSAVRYPTYLGDNAGAIANRTRHRSMPEPSGPFMNVMDRRRASQDRHLAFAEAFAGGGLRRGSGSARARVGADRRQQRFAGGHAYDGGTQVVGGGVLEQEALGTGSAGLKRQVAVVEGGEKENGVRSPRARNSCSAAMPSTPGMRMSLRITSTGCGYFTPMVIGAPTSTFSLGGSVHTSSIHS